MALFATHIRFARDLQASLSITDLNSYYSGVLYPDSRYLTGIKRDETHGDTVPKDPFSEGLSDFERGWATHLIYDETAGPQLLSHIPWPGEPIGQFNRVWQYITAEKIIEDMVSFELLDGELSGILAPQAQRGEKQEVVDRYFRIIKSLYETPPTLETYERLWKEFGADVEIVEPVIAFAKQIQEDEKMANNVSAIYESIINTANN